MDPFHELGQQAQSGQLLHVIEMLSLILCAVSIVPALLQAKKPSVLQLLAAGLVLVTTRFTIPLITGLPGPEPFSNEFLILGVFFLWVWAYLRGESEPLEDIMRQMDRQLERTLESAFSSDSSEKKKLDDSTIQTSPSKQQFEFNPQCPYCRDLVRDAAEASICNSCKVWHHAQCFRENGRCATNGCSGTVALRVNESDQENRNSSGEEQVLDSRRIPVGEK